MKNTKGERVWMYHHLGRCLTCMLDTILLKSQDIVVYTYRKQADNKNIKWKANIWKVVKI